MKKILTMTQMILCDTKITIKSIFRAQIKFLSKQKSLVCFFNIPYFTLKL